MPHPQKEHQVDYIWQHNETKLITFLLSTQIKNKMKQLAFRLFVVWGHASRSKQENSPLTQVTKFFYIKRLNSHGFYRKSWLIISDQSRLLITNYFLDRPICFHGQHWTHVRNFGARKSQKVEQNQTNGLIIILKH